MSLKYNLNTFRQYKNFLQNLKKNIYFYSFSLEDIFENASDLFSVKLKKTLALENIFISKEDNQSLDLFLKNLGRTDKTEQISNIEKELDFCEQRIKEERENLKEKSKINLLCYSFIGLAIALVLL